MMLRPLIVTALALVLPATAAATETTPPPPDPELLEFLGEIGGEDPGLIVYMDTREAKKALKQAAKDPAKEDSHE
jgi:hypothetical protein